MAFSICYWANYTQEKTKVIPEVRKRRDGWPGFEVFVWRRLTSCWILSAMSPEIQEWLHKSRSRINNLYLLTRHITMRKLSVCPSVRLYVRLSVRMSVCQMRGSWQNGRKVCPNFDTIRKMIIA